MGRLKKIICKLRCGYTAGKQTRRSAECESGTPRRFLLIAVRRPVKWQISHHIDRVAMRHLKMSVRRKRMLGSVAACCILLDDDISIKKKRKRWWMGSHNKSRSMYSASDMLADLKREPSGKFFNFCRMSETDFEFFINKIGHCITKTDTNMRKCIPVQERLAVALRFLATGDSYISLAYLFKFSRQTVATCVDEVCNALIETLRGEIKMPTTPEGWIKIAKEFEEAWNFPHCLGAIDGKHVLVQSPQHSGSEFYNYKGTCSIVLLGVTDANYCFTYVDVGCQGRISDGGVFRNSTLFKKISEKQLNLPPGTSLPEQNESVPYTFVGDDAFALTTTMMKPYAGVYNKGTKERIFNYRLSRARRIIENVFGIMSAVFRVLRRPILLSPEQTTNIVMTCVLLHNFLRRSKTSRSLYTPKSVFDTETDGEFQSGTWRNEEDNLTSMFPLRKVARKEGNDAKKVRDAFAEYFKTCGAVPWQDQ